MLHDAAAYTGVSVVGDIAEEVDAVGKRAKADIGFQLQLQGVPQKGRDLILPLLQLVAAAVDEHEVVDVAHIARRAQGVLDELVEGIEVDVGEELRRKVADRKAATGRGVLQPLVRRHAAALGGGRTVHHALALDGLAQQGMHNALRLDRHAAALHALLEHAIQRGTVHAVEEIADVELQVPATALATVHLAHHAPQGGDSSMRALTEAIGIAVVNEAGFVDSLQLRHQPVMHDPIGEVGSMDLPGFRLGGDETGGG